MNDLGLEPTALQALFSHLENSACVFVRFDSDHAIRRADALATAMRRCYIDDKQLLSRVGSTGASKAEILGAKLPDKGSTMAGDFGEILVFLYQAIRALPHNAIGPKKWRLKEDRQRPAPYSDVIHFTVPDWPRASAQDLLLCSEVKTKSTPGTSAPVREAIADSKKDRSTRLTKTLVWLRERALTEDLGSVTLDHLDRFINEIEHAPVQRHFRAVAVACSSLEGEVLQQAAETTSSECEVVVISVPDLKRRYQCAFQAARASLSQIHCTQ